MIWLLAAVAVASLLAGFGLGLGVARERVQYERGRGHTVDLTAAAARGELVDWEDPRALIGQRATTAPAADATPPPAPPPGKR